jgi:hypothetical protein
MTVLEKIASQKEKTALVGVDDALGGLVGYHYGKEQKKRGEKYSFGVPQGAAALFLPGGAGYQIGRGIAHHTSADSKKGKTKKSSIDLSLLSNEEALALSDELAPEVVKMAAPMGMLASGVGRMMAGAVKTPMMTRAAVGAGVGAAGGAVRHMMGGTNPQTGQKNTSLLGSMAGGAVLGGGIGAASRQAAMRIGTMNNGVGQYARQAMGARGAAMTAAGAASGKGVTRSANAMELIAKRNAAGRMATGGIKPGAAAAAAAPAAAPAAAAPRPPPVRGLA